MTKISTSRLLMLCLALTMTFFQACKDTDTIAPKKTVDTYDAKAIIEWNKKFLELERYAVGCRPTPAPRMTAYIGLAVYESCANGFANHRSIAANYPGLVLPPAEAGYNYHYPTVVNAAYGYMANEFFGAIPSIKPELLATIGSLRTSLENEFSGKTSPDIFAKSKAYGESVAKAVYEYAATDAVAHNHHLDPFKDNVNKYNPTDVPGAWKPTVPGPAKPMFPDAGYWRTLAIKENDFLMPNPIPYSESKGSKYYAQGLEVMNVNNEAVAGTDDRWLAFFWSDDLTNLTFSPGPRWLAIGNQVLEIEESNLETAVLMNAKVGLALNDAAIAAWRNKYKYNIQRPESYIKKVIDPSWEPILENPLTGDKGFTPPFPAYPSGHATMGGAGAEALSSVFGYDYTLTDRCHEGRSDFYGSAPRTFPTFKAMADENAYSRIPLGVHWRMDSEEGVRLGERVARKVNSLGWEK